MKKGVWIGVSLMVVIVFFISACGNAPRQMYDDYGELVGECITDNDCREGDECITELKPYFCQTNEGGELDEFEQIEFTDECAVDEDCPGGFTCATEFPPNYCTQGTCEQDKDCDGDLFCDFGYCYEEGSDCSSASDCGEGQEGFTVDCLHGYCQYTPPPECKSDNDCGAGYMCNTNDIAYCEQKTCEEDTSCGAGAFCDTGYCFTNGNDCLASSDCQAIDDGGSVTCNHGWCNYLPAPECANDDDCRPGTHCNTDDIAYCEQDICESDDECDEGTYCDFGVCYEFGTECGNVDDCAPGESCRNGFCLP